MSATKKAASKSAAAKKSASKPAAAHPSWIDMIKECISAHPEEARTGVSRPQIKKYVETKYKVEIGPAQATLLNKAIASGAKKGNFVLPKGLSGKVKLPPRKTAESTAAKENKPASKVVTKSAAKPKARGTTTTNATNPRAVKKTTATKASAKPAAKVPAAKKVSVKKAPVKKAPSTVKKASSARKAPAKKAATGTTKAKTAATKPKVPAKKTASKASSTRRSK